MTVQDWQDFGILLGLLLPQTLACAWLVQKLWHANKRDTEPGEQAKKWGLFVPIIIVVAGYFLFAYILAPVYLGSLYGLFFSDTSPTIDAWIKLSYVNFSFALLVTVLQMCLLFWYVLYKDGSLRSLGLNRPRAKHVLNAVVAYGIYLVIYVVIFSIIAQFVPSINVDQEQEIGFESAAGIEVILAFLSLVILPPISEELLMRGFLYRALKKKLPRYGAIIFTSVLFAGAHLQLGSGGAPLWIAAVDTFILSLALIYLCDYSKSLWPAIFLHMLKNSIAFVSLFILAR
jgi:membrane protease YdiL (CAAX protease family)